MPLRIFSSNYMHNPHYALAPNDVLVPREQLEQEFLTLVEKAEALRK